MHSSPEVSPTPQWLTLARLVAAAFGLYHGYLVGAQIGGLPFGIVMAAKDTSLAIVMTPSLAAVLFGLTIVMCSLAAVSAIVKVTRIDPGTVFSR